jgi:hypothetical protein
VLEELDIRASPGEPYKFETIVAALRKYRKLQKKASGDKI